MRDDMTAPRGRQFLHVPGPTNIPDRILRAMDRPAVDFTSPEFRAVADECFEGLQWVFKTRQPVIAFAGSGHGAWEAALVNVLSPGDRVLMAETGAFSHWWRDMARAHGADVTYLPGDWRHGVDPAAIEVALRKDTGHSIKALAVVHNETATGIVSDIAGIRGAMNRAGHPAMLLVDIISSLGSMDFRMDEWQVDVAVGGSQKGLMLPPGLGFTAISEKALKAAQQAKMARFYWSWARLLGPEGKPGFAGTPAVHLFYGLQEALRVLREEGLDAVFARHRRLAGAVRAAAVCWARPGGPALNALVATEQSNSVSTIRIPEGFDPEAVRAICRERYNVILGGGLLDFAGKVIRIGHLGDLNEPMILGALAAVEMAFIELGIPHDSGLQAAMAGLVEPRQNAPKA
mgnify:CR=1 FL=1